MTARKREQQRSTDRHTKPAQASNAPESRLTLVLRAVRNVNQLITREKDRSTLLRRACEILTETRGYRSAWIGLGDAGRLMRIAAESGIGEGFAAARAEWERTGWPACGRQALADGEVAVLHDPKTNCTQCPLSRTYRDSAALAAPLRHEGRDYGVLVVALPRAAADDAEERSLLAEVAGDLAFALHATEVEDRHRAAEAREAHLKQVLLAIRNVNQLIVQEGNPRRLIDRACRNLTETMGYGNAWIALLGGEAARGLGLPEASSVAAVAAAGSGDACDRLVERLVRGEFTACMQRALAAAHLVVEGDPAANCPDCPLHDAYDARAGFVRRLDFEGVVYGILAVSVPAAYAQNAEEQDLFGEVAGDLAFALHKIAAARELEQARRRYREIFENSRDGFVMMDSAGKVLDANEAYCSMLGYTLDELRALPDLYAITPERWHAWEKDEMWQKRLLGKGCSGLYEKEYIRKDGVVLPVELRSHVVRRDDGEIDYLWGTTRCITERKVAEEALREGEKRLHMAMGSASEGVWELDLTTGLVTFDDVMLRMIGYEPDFPPQTVEWWCAQIHAEDRPAVDAAFSAFMAGETETYGTEFRLAAKTGGYVWVASNARIVRADEQGDPLLVVGIHRDITHRKLAEGKLKAIEWMLSKEPSAGDTEDQDYGDLTALNRDGLILRSVGRDTLSGLCSDFLRLLDTSAAVYEKNGDYAYGIFASGWCRMMDGASRALCRTADNREALASGKWLCHESCWTECSRRAIDSKAPVDIACHGGIRIYSVPILSAGEVIGAINFGYGEPPRDADTLESLAASYGVDPEELAREAAAYESRPAFIVEQAKQQLLSSARLIGAIVERTLSEDALRESEDLLNRTGEMAQVGGWEVDLDTSRVIWTRTTRRIHELPDGYVPDLDEAIGYYHPEDQDHVRQCVQRALENDEPFDFTLRLITAKGRERWVHALGQPVFDADRCVRLSGTFQDVTEQKQAERALEASEARYVRLAANIPGVVFQNLQRSDDPADDEFPYISPGIHDLFGLTPEEVMRGSSAIWTLIHPEDMDELTASVQRAAEINAHWSHEFRITTIGGETKWVYGAASHERRSDGSIFWDGLFLDITERKLAEAALDRQNTMLARAEALAHVGSWEWDIAVDRVRWSDELFRIFGRDPHKGAPSFAQHPEFYLPEDMSRLEEAVHRCVSQGTPYELDLRAIRPDGEIRHCVARGRAEADETGRIVRLAGSLQDLTEQKKLASEIDNQRRRLESLMNAIPAPVFFKGKDGRYLGCNPAFEVLTGRTAAQIVGKTVHEVWPEKYGAKYQESDLRLLETGGMQQYEFKLPDAQGEEREVVIHKAAYRGPSGEIDGLVGVILDITERTRQTERIALLGRMLDEAPVSVTIHDAGGEFLYANKASQSMHGYGELDEFLALNLHGLDVPESEQRIAERIRLIEASGEARFEVRHFRKDRSDFPLEVQVKLIQWRGRPALLSIAVDITQRKEAEQALRYSENLFRRVFELLPVGLWIADRNGKLMQGNPAGVRIWGAEPHVPQEEYGVFKARRLPSGEEIAPEDWALAHTINEGRTVVDELLEIDGFDGAKRVIVNYTAPVMDENGQVLAAIVVNRDITDQYRAEQALKKSEQNYRLLADTTLDVIWLMDMELRFVYVNPAILAMTGYAVAEWVGTRLPDHCDEEAFGRMTAVIEAEVAKGPHPDGAVFESTMRRKDGTSFFVEIHGKVVFDDTGAPRFLQGVTRDVTERKRMEAQNQVLADIIKRSRDFIGVADQNQTPFFVNPAGQELVGLDGDEAVARTSIREYFLPEDLPYVESTILPAVMETGRWAGEFRFRHFKTGEPVPVLYDLFRTIDPETGAITNFATITRDITDRKRAEHERESLDAQLQQAQKMESVGRLAGGVAHDFNNLLMGILGYAELCRDDIAPDHPVREWLDEITNEANRSANLVRQLLAFARKQTIAPCVLDLNEAVEGMLKMLRRLIGEDIDLSWQPGRRLWQVRMDPGQIDQILANLCVNARDAIAGVGEVIIETENAAVGAEYCAGHSEAREGRFVVMMVSDDGSGMSADTLEHLFEPFFTTKEQGKGTGLGLATVYGIVKQNGGFINVYSEPGKGTTFRIYLPSHQTAEAPVAAASEDAARTEGTETILLVEDEKSVRVTSARSLTDLGYNVLTADSPETALRLVEEHGADIDLLITDVVLPGMNGRELAETLQPRHPSLKVLYMSGYTANVIVHRGILDASTHFLSKPVTRDALARKVREVLDED